MRKYVKPNTETTEIIYGSVLCNSNDGTGQQGDPIPGGPPGA